MKKGVYLLLIISITSAWLSACGQKGALYLPSTPKTPQKSTPELNNGN